MESNVAQLMGCGKMSKHFLNRITSRYVKGIDGKKYAGASSLEQAALIYFKQVCDKKNYVSGYKIQELEKLLGCSKRAVPVIIHSLVKKGFITACYSDKNWTGIKNIKIIDKDFSETKIFKGENRYLSVYYCFLNSNKRTDYDKYMNLSLFAKRLLLVLLYNYQYNYGYRVSYDELKERLGVKSRVLIHSYLKELESIFGEEYFHSKASSKLRLHYGIVVIHSKNFIFNHGLENSQDTYYKRKMRQYLVENQVVVSAGISRDGFVNSMFGFIYRYLLKGIDLVYIEDQIKKWILLHDNLVSNDLLRWLGVLLESKIPQPSS